MQKVRWSIRSLPDTCTCHKDSSLIAALCIFVPYRSEVMEAEGEVVVDQVLARHLHLIEAVVLF